MHENIIVYIEKKRWYLGILNKCKHLQDDHRCGVYENRPQICREYSTENCDYHGGEYDFQILFTSAEQFRGYAEKKLGQPLIEPPKPPRIKRVGGRLSLPVMSS